MADGRNFLLDSDYPIDQVVFMHTYQVTTQPVFSGYSVTARFDHGLPFRPLAIGQWSPGSDFSGVTLEAGDYMDDGSDGGRMSIDVYTTSSQIIILGQSYTSARTLYIRVTCFAPDDWSGNNLASTVGQSNRFILNTDWSYPQLVLNSHIRVPQNSTRTVSHGLGYIPQIMLWQVYPNMSDILGLTVPFYSAITGNGVGDGDSQYRINENSLTIVNDIPDGASGNWDADIYYRIYGAQ